MCSNFFYTVVYYTCVHPCGAVLQGQHVYALPADVDLLGEPILLEATDNQHSWSAPLFVPLLSPGAEDDMEEHKAAMKEEDWNDCVSQLTEFLGIS